MIAKPVLLLVIDKFIVLNNDISPTLIPLSIQFFTLISLNSYCPKDKSIQSPPEFLTSIFLIFISEKSKSTPSEIVLSIKIFSIVPLDLTILRPSSHDAFLMFILLILKFRS